MVIAREDLTLHLTVTLDGAAHHKHILVPREHWVEARRRMASPSSPDGVRYCLNHCFLPLYQWVRHQYWVCYEEAVWARRGNGIAYPPWETTFAAHEHVGTARHWFQPPEGA